MRKHQLAAFIGGAGHSGSTLLGLALGAHPSVFYAGEARKSLFLGDERKPLRKRTCKVCGPDCRVWSDLELDADLYEALAERTGRPVIVDSTKSLDWLHERSAAMASLGVKQVLFFLGRDGRAVVSSGLRKYPERSAEEHAKTWVAQMRATEAFAATFAGDVVRVRYEQLVSAPEHVLTQLAAAMALPFDEAMLHPFESEQHPLGGNAGTQSLLAGGRTHPEGPLPISGDKRSYYEAHPKTFVLDLRWQRELDADALAAFEVVAGETNRAYAWEP